VGILGRLIGLGDKNTNKAETRASELRTFGFTPIRESIIIDEGVALIRKNEGKYRIEIAERYQSNISPRLFCARVHTYTHEHSAGDDMEEDDFLVLRIDRSGSSLSQVGNGMKGVHPTLEVLLHYES